MKKSPLIIIFTTVCLDLIGFGMVIPLVGVYGRHFGATGFQLAILGAIFSLMQFAFSPFWGSLSDRIGRRPVLLLSLAGSTFSYLAFGLAPNFALLFASRMFAGIFAANISTAQAYIADVTTPAERAKGMGMIGAAFGIGFTLGPPLGGIASAKLGLAAPGIIASLICGINLIAAYFRLPESLGEKLRQSAKRRSISPLNFKALNDATRHPLLWALFLMFFFATFAFSNMEQTFSLLFQGKFNLTTEMASYKSGLVLMWAGFLGALVQGGLIRKLVPLYGEYKLLVTGFVLNAASMVLFPFVPTYGLYYFIMTPVAIGQAFINPTLASLISKNAPADEQGGTLGLSQALGSLARAAGPFCGLLTFVVEPYYPFMIAATISCGLIGLALLLKRRFVNAKNFGNVSG